MKSAWATQICADEQQRHRRQISGTMNFISPLKSDSWESSESGGFFVTFRQICRSAIGTVLCLAATYGGAPATMLTHEQAKQDLEFLARAVEQTHPDPYTAFGGADEFRAAAQHLVSNIPSHGMSEGELYLLVRTFLSRLEDLHTGIRAPASAKESGEEAHLPLWFTVAQDEIFVSHVSADHDALLGARLRSIDRVTVEELTAAAATVWPSENEFGARRWLSRMIRRRSEARKLLPDAGAQLEFVFLDVNGNEFSTMIATVDEAVLQTAPQRPDASRLSVDTQREIWSGFLGDDRKIGYLWVPHMMSREAFQIMRARNVSDLEERLSRKYDRSLRRDRPANLDEAIAGIPSLAETLAMLLTEMRDSGSTHLIIDLRENGGGWSALVSPVLYLLYGDSYFAAEFPVTWTYRVSQFYLDKFSMTLEEFNEGLDQPVGIGELYVRPDRRPSGGPARRADYLDGLREDGLGFVESLEPLDGVPIHSSTVVVLTSTKTGSSAFHLLYYLWRMGATVVGTTPAQAANAFMDATPLTLPNSELQVTVSHSALIMFPEDAERGKSFTPDHPMLWSDFDRFGYDRNAEVLKAMELIQSGKIR